MNYENVSRRLDEITDEMRRIDEKDDVTDADHSYFVDLAEEAKELRSNKENLERKAIIDGLDVKTGNKVSREHSEFDDDPFRAAGGDQGFHNPWDTSEMRTWGKTDAEVNSEIRARALDAVEKVKGSNDGIRQTMTDFIENHDDSQGTISKLTLATTDPNYVRAFWKIAQRGQAAILSDDEKSAVQRADSLKRAMSLTDSAGGYLIPQQLDPTVILTSDGSLNQIRQVARQVVATGDVWYGVSAPETSFSWDSEGSEISDDASSFSQPAIEIHKGAGFVPISIEAMMDENAGQEVARLLAAGKDTLEATAFATGSGSGQPTGIVTELTGGAQEVASATTDTFALADVYSTKNTPAARYRMRGSWLANDAIYDSVRQFTVGGGADIWEQLQQDRPANLLGKPALEAEGMDGVINATAENYVLVFGDFSHYVIADRVGLTVELIPHLFATANNRPSGQRGWYAFFRVGAESVNDSAFGMLNVT